MLTDPQHEHHTDPASRGIDDQMALNILFGKDGDIAVDEGVWPRGERLRAPRGGVGGEGVCIATAKLNMPSPHP